VWPCAFWPGQPVEPLVASAAPAPSSRVLILQNQRDPATPLPGAVDLKAYVGANAQLLLADAGGHAIYGLQGNGCVDAAATTFLTTGTVPYLYCPAQPPAMTVAGGPGSNAARALLNQLVSPLPAIASGH
jgi:hypothetical protein